MRETISIESGTLIDDFDRHFRVLAGPGAGKTYWLVRHIRNVIKKSKRLPPPSRIACISYTTVAAEEIKARLEEAADRVEVSTIHSFLYKNIVKPYLHLVLDEDGNSLLDSSRVDGHDEHPPTRGMLQQWIKADSKVRFLGGDAARSLKYLAQLTYRFDSNGILQLANRKHLGKIRSGNKEYSFPINKAFQYKKLNWELGRLHHEDVLYFAHRIATEHLELGEFLAAKFPYIYLDEFQDTNPIQTRLIKWMAVHGSTVGVIGDPAQSIYAFQNARRQDFIDFKLPDQVDYVIAGNRRSTEQIVTLLNSVRGSDILQKCIRGEQGISPQLLVGDVTGAIKIAKSIMTSSLRGEADGDLVILSRTNEEVSRIRNPDLVISTHAWDELNTADHERHRFIRRVITAGELAAQGSFERSCKELLKCFKTPSGELKSPLKYTDTLSEIDKRGIAVGLLEMLITERPLLTSGSLHNLYVRLSGTLSALKPGLELTAVKKGAFKETSERLTYRDLMSGVSLIEEKRVIRTIHNAKGLEFAGVLVYLEPADLRHVLSPKIDDEECRVVYVALSRATDYLFISVPSLSAEDETRLVASGFELTRCNGVAH